MIAILPTVDSKRADADAELKIQLRMAAMIIRLCEIETDDDADGNDNQADDDADTVHPLEELMRIFSEIASSYPYSKCQVDEMLESFKMQVKY